METNPRYTFPDAGQRSSDVRSKSPSGDKQQFLRQRKGILETTLGDQREQLQKIDQLYHDWKEAGENLFVVEKTIADLQTYTIALGKEKEKIEKLNETVKSLIETFKTKEVGGQFTLLSQKGWIKRYKKQSKTLVSLLHKAKDGMESQINFLSNSKGIIDACRRRQQNTAFPTRIQHVKDMIAGLINSGIECKEIDFNSITDSTIRIQAIDHCLIEMKILSDHTKTERSETKRKLAMLDEMKSQLQKSPFANKHIRLRLSIQVFEKIESLLNRAVTVNRSSDQLGQLGQLQQDLEAFHNFTAQLSIRLPDTDWSNRISKLCTSAPQKTIQMLHSEIIRNRKDLEAKLSIIGDTDELRHTKKAIEFLTAVESTETGTNSANNLAHIQQQVGAIFTYCKANDIKIKEFHGLEQINNLYTRLKQEEQLRKDHSGYQQSLENSKIAFEAHGTTDADKAVFATNLTKYLEAHLSYVRDLGETHFRVNAIVDFFDSTHQKFPEALEDFLSDNDRKIKDIEDNIDRNIQLLEAAGSNQRSTQEQIDQYERSTKADFAKDINGDISTEDTYNWLNSRRTQLEAEIRDTDDELTRITQELTKPENVQSANTKEGTALPDSRLPLEISSEDTSLDIKNLLADKNIFHYTNQIRKEYSKKYGKKVDIEIAVRSAQFLQNLVKDRRKYIPIAADLIHEFEVGLDSFHMNTETLKVEIVDPGTKRNNLVQLRLNRYGDLVTADGKKLKCSVIASQAEDPYKCILSIRSPRIRFAPETPMQQSGSANIEDLGQLRKGGDMNILYHTVQREFREEAPGYEIAQGTLQPTEQFQEIDNERILHFRANIEKDPSREADNQPGGFAETTGTWELDIRDLLGSLRPLPNSSNEDRNAFVDYDFTNNAHRLAVKKFLLEKAAQKGFISSQAEQRGQRSKDYLRSSYNVDHLVDYIGKCATELARERRQEAKNIFWRLIGEEEWQQHRTS